jgi:cryptochrome
MGYTGTVSHKFPGGEKEALKRLNEQITARPAWVAQFQKPETAPNSLEPSTTVLSPYLKFGCLSPSLFYHELERIYKTRPHTEPPMSLHGQV